MRLFSGAAEPQEYGYLYRSICHDVHNKIKQFILFQTAHTITILILVISSHYRALVAQAIMAVMKTSPLLPRRIDKDSRKQRNACGAIYLTT